MKRLFLTIFLFSGLTVWADVGVPSVQAVVRVTTTDGKTHEGFVSLMIGGYDGFHPNGFYFFQDDHYNWIIPFDYDFEKWNKINDAYQIRGLNLNAKDIYFIAYIGDSDSWLRESKEIISDSSGRYLTTQALIQRKYLMLDTLSLFITLPKYLHLDYQNMETKRINIPVKDIISFEIIYEPAEKWLTEIEQKRKACFAEVYGESSTGDFLEPSWMHVLIKDSETLKHWKEYFEKYRN